MWNWKKLITYTKKNCDVYGIDVSKTAIDKYKKNGLNGAVVNVQDGMPFKNNTFNIVFMSEVIEHIENTNLLLAEIKQF